MDLMKVFDQTVRDLKREVNKKVLKVPEIEQKVLDATSNEPWGPHGTLMGEIAQATRNFNEYQMIMAILWKRLMDTGKNWRHVYKSLTVLEFLVAHGAERVIDELLEHTYQIQSLVDFQYVEPNGKDQGINIQKKAQSLISLINDRDKIREVRQKAATNRDKYHGISSTGGIHKSSSYSSTYGGYGNNKPNRDEDEYGRYGGKDDDSYGESKDRDTGRYRDDHYSRERYRDDDDYGNGKARDGRQKYNDREPDLDYDDDDNHYSSRQTKSKTLAPNYEEAFQSADTKGSKGITTGAVAQKSGSIGGSFHAASVDDFDDFDPRAGTIKSVPATGKAEPDFFGSSTPDFFGSAAPSSLAPKATSLDPLQDLFADTNFQSSSHVSTAEVNDNFFAMPEQRSATPGTTFLQPDSTSHILASNAGAFDLFSSTSTSHTADLFAESTFTAFESASKSNNTPLSTTFGMPPPAAFEAFPEQNKSGTQPFGFFSEPASHSLPQQASTQPASFQHGQAGDPFRTNGLSQAQQKGKFEPKSSVWADSLTSGLIDLNITAPKSNALADLGINLGTAGMKTEWKPEEKVQSMAKGKAMGSGSGLGIAAASGLPPPPPPPTLGANMGMGIGTAQGFTAPNVFGNAPGIGINMNVGAGGNGDIGSGLGMGSGFGMPAGMQMNSASGTGSGPGMGMGMGMRSVGGYTNTQHQFGSFM